MKLYFQFVSKWLVIFFGILFLMISCQSTRDQTSNITEPIINQEILSEEGEKILVGAITRAGLAGEAYKYWFDEEYQNYNLDTQTLSELQESINSIEILVFLGTWCSDSQRELPHFYKIMDYLGISDSQYNIIALDNHTDRYKKSPQHEEEGWEIEYVPTFIILQADKEIGRIVEAPMETLEKDLKTILQGADIVH